MDVVYRLGSATATEVTSELPDPPTATAVRTLLRILEEKGHLNHQQDGVRHVYMPTVPAEKVRKSVIGHVIRTFFNGSAEQAMVTLIDSAGSDLTDAELARLADLIRKRRSHERAGK